MKRLILGVVAAFLVSGCSERKNLSPLPTISDESRAALQAPINCRTAREDINTLESERASTAKQILSGVRMVMPIAAVAGILLGDYRDRVAVTTGQYNRDLELKIEQIKSTCGIQ